jgi:hypothetical protein
MKGVQKVLLAAAICGLSTQAGAAGRLPAAGLNLVVPGVITLSAMGAPVVGRVTALTSPAASKLVPIGAPMLFGTLHRFAAPYNMLTNPKLPGLD